MNNDLISRSELAEVVAKKINNPAIKSWLFAIINEIPTADTGRHGEWKVVFDGNGKLYENMFECSVCKTTHIGHPHVGLYCPNCGAKMGGGEE